MAVKIKFPLALVILIVGLVLAVGLVVLKPTPKAKPKPEPKPVLVSVVEAQPSVHHLSVRTQGTVTPRREISLVTEVSGRVIKVSPNFVSGGFVAANELLVEIDPRDYQYALIQAESQVAEATQRLATERGQARQKKREWRDLGNSEANDLFLRKPQIAAAQANLEAARANRDKAELNLQRTRISLPFAGRIRTSNVDLGQYVNPGFSIAQAYDTSVVEVRLPLTDSEAALLDLPLGFKANDEAAGVAVTVEGVIAGESYQWPGTIKRTDASLDTRSRLYYAIAEIKDPFIAGDSQAPLVVGLFVEAEISGRALEQVIELPKAAVYKRDQIYRLGANNRLEQLQIRVMKKGPTKIWVKGNINSGDKVVVGKQQFLSAGVQVDSQAYEAEANEAEISVVETSVSETKGAAL